MNFALAYHRERGLPVVIGRFFNITGPRQSSAYGMVLPSFLRAALASEACWVLAMTKSLFCMLPIASAPSSDLSMAA